jgi:integrase
VFYPVFTQQKRELRLCNSLIINLLKAVPSVLKNVSCIFYKILKKLLFYLFSTPYKRNAIWKFHFYFGNYIVAVDIDKISPQDALNAISGATALINKYLKKVAKKAEIQKNISTHVARHTFAYLMVAKNVNPFIMKELLGHSDIRVTQIYAKASKANKDRAIDSLDDLEDLLVN